MPDLPNDLTFFTVTRTVHTDGVLNADVRFEAQVLARIALLTKVFDEIVEVLMTPVYARLVNGELVDNAGNPGMELLSASGVPAGFKWLVTFTNSKVNGISRPLSPLIFEAPLVATEFDLKDAEIYTGDREYRGAPAPGLIGGRWNGDSSLVLQNADGSFLSPIPPAPAGSVIVIDNGDGTLNIG